jgi:hypothetical protein
MLIARNRALGEGLDPMAAEILDALRFPGSEDELAERLRRSGWEEEGLSVVPALLAELRAAGQVVTAPELVQEALGESPRGAPPLPGIGALAWITADRPELLARSLAAWGARLAADQEGFPDIIIADDSRRYAAETRAVVDAFARQYPGTTRLLDRGFRTWLAAELESGLPAELSGTANFALGLTGSPSPGTVSSGGNRNLVLLACAGRTVVTSDDDTLPEFRLWPGATDGIRLTSAPLVWRLAAFGSGTDLEAFGTAASGPLLGPHRQLLGASGRTLDPTACRTDLARAEAAQIRRFFGPGPIIRALAFGYWGDAGTITTRYLLTSRHILEEEEMTDDEYRARSHGRLVFRSPAAVTVGKAGMMGLHLALDLREAVPPFLPFGRNQDALWLYFLSLLHPDGEVGYPVAAIRHLPTPRTSSPEQDSAGWAVCLNDQVRLLLDACGAEDGADLSSYAAVAEVLGHIAGQSDEVVAELSRRRVAEYLATRMEILEAAYRRYDGQPAAWGQTTVTLCRNLQAWQRTGQDSLPPETPAGAVRAYLGELGRLFAAWPRLYRRAMALAATTAGTATGSLRT